MKSRSEDIELIKEKETLLEIVNKPKDSKDKIQTPFYCKSCDCSLQDNQAYLDHLNGKRHNQLLGMNMRVEKVGVDKVREKLLNLKRKNEKPLKTKSDLTKNLEELEKIE